MIGKQQKARSFLQCIVMVLAATLAFSGAAAKEKQELPQTTTDGLNLTKQTEQRIVYVADDVDFGAYTKVMIVDCAVAFAKNWQRDYNRTERDLSRQVKDHDVTRMKDTLSAEFKKVFTETMTENGIEVVTEAASDVIILRPAIVNLTVNAPDIQAAGRSRTYAASSDAGQMTLYLELYDSVSSAILAKVMDAQAMGRGTPTMSYANRVTNISAADHTLKDWANEIASHFGAATNPNFVDEAEADDEAESKD